MAYDVARAQILSQPVSSFLQGRAMRAAEEESGARMKALEAAEGREQEAFQMKKEDRQAKYDEINGKKVLAGAEQVLSLPKGQRKAFVEKNFPDLVQKLSEQEYGWEEVDEDEIEEMALGVRARAAADLGISPGKPEAFTLGKGEQRFSGDKMVAENTTPEEEDWTKPEPAMIGGKEVMAQYNNKKGTFRVVEGVSPISKNGGEKDKTFEKANTLRDEFVTQAKDFTSVQASYSTIQALAKSPSAAGDIGLLTSYMRMVDPGSTVREGEFATAANAGGVPDRIRAQYNNALRGERLSDSQRKDFVAQAKNMFEARKGEHAKLRGRYKDLATRADIDPLDVIGADAEESITISSDDEYDALPSGTVFTAPDGTQRRKP